MIDYNVQTLSQRRAPVRRRDKNETSVQVPAAVPYYVLDRVLRAAWVTSAERYSSAGTHDKIKYSRPTTEFAWRFNRSILNL